MQGAPDSIPGSWFPGNKETAESRKQAREPRPGGVIEGTSRGESGEPAGRRLGTRNPGGQTSGPAPPRGRARDCGPGECAPTCCRGGDRAIRPLSERVQGGPAAAGRRARREVSRLTQAFRPACQGRRPGSGRAPRRRSNPRAPRGTARPIPLESAPRAGAERQEEGRGDVPPRVRARFS